MMKAYLEGLLARWSRKIGKPKGWERVIRELVPPGTLVRSNAYPLRLPEGYAFLVAPNTLIGWNIHFFGTYEPEVRQWIGRLLKPGDVAFDVGANVGWHALWMAGRVGLHGEVHAFEPNPTTFDRLQNAVRMNGFEQIRPHPIALTDHKGKMGFEAPPAGTLWDGTGRLVPGEEGNVDCISLDRFISEHPIKRLDLLKIDVEGWEYAVLLGGEKTIREFHPPIIFEFDPNYVVRCGGSWNKMARHLEGRGYELFFLNPRGRKIKIKSEGPPSGNILALPKNWELRIRN